ncbi:hypothetical protein RSSM_04858 [Rhodopirellula sallentina SM41]|uniref:Uncharacterized protein n=1 Tax=Rhodopirellula sallentina SM41 TaxID=1263870 RepID=M5TWZ3_9BACT|nr:hypothetical protein RSSM_04858 [Rhodopirellula sallentina SM41]
MREVDEKNIQTDANAGIHSWPTRRFFDARSVAGDAMSGKIGDIVL